MVFKHFLSKINTVFEITVYALFSFVMSNCDVVTFPLVSGSDVVHDCIDS